MQVIGQNRVTDWPKLGPALLIATALVVAIRTARWTAQLPQDVQLSEVDPSLDKEIDFALRITNRLLHTLLKKHPSMFAQRLEAVYAPDDADTQL